MPNYDKGDPKAAYAEIGSPLPLKKLPRTVVHSVRCVLDAVGPTFHAMTP